MRFDDQISLACGAYNVRLSPGAGARITALTWFDGRRDRHLLVPSDATASFDPHDWPKTGAFPMAPFTNKLENGRFTWNGREIVLPTPADSPHALHGLAHRKPWTLAHATREHAALRYSHKPTDEGWPWSFDLNMDVTVTADHVQVDLQIRNTSAEPMPAGLGWHPFHPVANPVLTLTAAARHDAGPQGLAVLTPSNGQAVHTARTLKGLGAQSTVFEEWDGRLSLSVEKNLVVDVEATGARHLFCHVPAHARHVCLEPVTLMPGALRHDDEAQRAACVALAPGAARAIRWRCAARLHT
ncbi:hypothetical protein [Hydrogenophaga sp. 2FB]|uniref:aldose epimerase family protein n=1 Tax=Hydrogenophaga sp. 2FB TaxID=2502187 RepID=UPI0010F50028|nr:hypothetical protein [Hydrogenophaga sp. 2FB]